MTNEKTLYRGVQIVWYLIYILEALLLLRFVLRLLGANPDAGFTQLIYGLSSIPLAPFSLVFPTNNLGSSAFEWSTILAMIVYSFVAGAIIKLLSMSRNVSSIEADQELRAQEETDIIL